MHWIIYGDVDIDELCKFAVQAINKAALNITQKSINKKRKERVGYTE